MSDIENQPQQPDIQSKAQAKPDVDEKTAGKILVNGEALEKWPEDLFIPPDALEVFLETFQGPLDLLLYLIRKQNLDILNIPVARITKQFMEYVELMRKLHLDLAAEYLVMAAMLAEIKSRMLLPRPKAEQEEEEEDPRAALVRRLQEYERFNQAGQDLDHLERVDRELYLVSAAFEDPKPVEVKSRASLNDLVLAFRNVIERSDLNKKFQIGKEGLTVREKMTHILDKIRGGGFLKFEDLFSPEEGRLGLVVSFIAILELVKDDTLVVVQNEPFAPIHLKAADS